MKKKRQKTPRQKARGLVRDRERLARMENSRERPIEVTSAAVIPVRARAQPCHQCGGTLHLEDERAETAELRAVDLQCQRCGARRELWFRIRTALPN